MFEICLMKVLFIGEFSNVHFHLKEALESLGHEVLLVTNDGGWRKYYSDLQITRKSGSLIHTLSYLLSLSGILPKLKGFDVVQINNPAHFFQLKASRNLQIYNYLKKHNKKIFLAGYATDYYWVKSCLEDGIFRYSEFKIGEQLIDSRYNLEQIHEWMHTEKKNVNIEIAETCNGIPCCLYEYFKAYQQYFPDKATFIPLPINMDSLSFEKKGSIQKKIKFFIGIQKEKNELKGTDIMLRALQKLQLKYPEEIEILKAESVPYHEYQQMMDGSDIILDQLYSYTPSMNSLIAMAKGLVVVGGGEPENYAIINETELRPIINVLPSEEDVFNKLEWLVLNKEEIPRLSRESIEYVKKHHYHIQVAKQYLEFWESK